MGVGKSKSVYIMETHWRGLPAMSLESGRLRAVFVPDLGAKMVSLFDMKHDHEWLIDSSDRPLRPIDYGASFVDQDMSGWDEMFPTVTSCRYPGQGPYASVSLPDHGEVWSMPWQASMKGDGLIFTVEGKALPYQLTRWVTVGAAGELRLEYRLTNLGHDPFAYLWAAHPQFVAGPETQIILPAEVDQVCNVLPSDIWGPVGTRHTWPRAIDHKGMPWLLDRIRSATARECRKFYIPPEQSVGQAGLKCQKSGRQLMMSWCPVQTPYLGIWVDEGCYNSVSTVALEPASGYFDSLETASRLGRAPIIESGASHEWYLTVNLS